MFWVKVHEADGHVIVTVVDEELMGKEFREGDAVLKIDEYFFKGELLDEDLALSRMSSATSLYVVGERAVDLAVKGGFVHPKAVGRIGGVPYAQMILVSPI
ncbi:MAG: DUF424 family protein [Crenarchaeota archaeon]|nr:DUF424 family protein [Thermoproteota archaeon]